MVGCGLEGGDGEDGMSAVLWPKAGMGVSTFVADSPSIFRGAQIADTSHLPPLTRAEPSPRAALGLQRCGGSRTRLLGFSFASELGPVRAGQLPYTVLSLRGTFSGAASLLSLSLAAPARAQTEATGKAGRF